jgi:hypothetical protein
MVLEIRDRQYQQLTTHAVARCTTGNWCLVLNWTLAPSENHIQLAQSIHVMSNYCQDAGSAIG